MTIHTFTTYTCMHSLYYYDDSKHTGRTNFCDYETMKWNAKERGFTIILLNSR